MKLSDNQLKVLAIFSSTLAVYMLMAGAGLQPERKVAQFLEDSYEMIRPLTFETSFSLADRLLDRTLNKPAPMVKKVLKRPTDMAQTNAQATNPAQAAANAKNAKKNNAKKNSQLKVDVVDTRESDESTESAAVDLSDEFPQQATNRNLAQLAKDDSKNTISAPKLEEKTEDEKLTPEQWRALMLNNPNQALATKFMKAKRDGQFSETFYYEISKELVADANEEKRQIGLLLLQTEPSSLAFVILSHYYSSLQGDDKANFFSQYLQPYSQSSRHADLNQVLAGSDQTSLNAAISLIDAMTTQIKSSSNTAANSNETQSNDGPRSIRNSASTSGSGLTVEMMKKFIPAITKLTQIEDQSLSGLAQTLLASLQSLSQS